MDLLRSGPFTGHIIDRFQLQTVYHARYRIDAARHFVRKTAILQDK